MINWKVVELQISNRLHILLLKFESRIALITSLSVAEPRVFAFGANTEFCLGVPEPMDGYLAVPMEIHIPPVYKMQTTGRHTIFWCHNTKFYGSGVARFCLKHPGSQAYLETARELDIKPLNNEVTNCILNLVF